MEFTTHGKKLVIYVRRYGPVPFSPLDIVTGAMRSPDIDCRRHERDGRDWLIHVFDKNGTRRIYRINKKLTDRMRSALILGQYFFEIDPESRIDRYGRRSATPS